MKLPRQQQKTNSSDDLVQHAYEFGYHWFAFYQARLEERNLKGHHLRDGAAFRELSVALDRRGGHYETLFRNGPATVAQTRENKELIDKLVEEYKDPRIEEIAKYRDVDESSVHKGDVLVVVTRLPMDDYNQKDKVQVQPGFTSLEQKILRVCRPYLTICSRSHVRLADPLAAELPAGYANRADIMFRAVREPWYYSLAPLGARVRRARSNARRTAAYLLQLPRVPELNGADLLVMWGQGGTQTLVFAQRLRKDLSHLLDRYGFTMVEMDGPEVTLERDEEGMESFRLLDKALEWHTNVLLEGVLLEASGERVAPDRAVREAQPPQMRKNRPAVTVRPTRSDERPARSDA